MISKIADMLNLRKQSNGEDLMTDFQTCSLKMSRKWLVETVTINFLTTLLYLVVPWDSNFLNKTFMITEILVLPRVN